MTTVKKALQREVELVMLLSQLKTEIIDAVKEAKPLPGVKPIGDGKLNCAVVRLNALRENSFNLSAEYYLPSSQADAVKTRISGAKTVTELIARVTDIVETKSVKANGTTLQLNNSTIEALKKYAKEGVV